MAHGVRVRILLPPSICRSIRALVCFDSAPAPSDLACSLQGLVLPLGAEEMVGARSQYNGGQGEEGFVACRSNAVRSRLMMRAVPPVRATATSALLLAAASHPPGRKEGSQGLGITTKKMELI